MLSISLFIAVMTLYKKEFLSRINQILLLKIILSSTRTLQLFTIDIIDLRWRQICKRWLTNLIKRGYEKKCFLAPNQIYNWCSGINIISDTWFLYPLKMFPVRRQSVWKQGQREVDQLQPKVDSKPVSHSGKIIIKTFFCLLHWRWCEISESGCPGATTLGITTFIRTTLSIMTFSIMTFSIMTPDTVMLSVANKVIMLNVVVPLSLATVWPNCAKFCHLG